MSSFVGIHTLQDNNLTDSLGYEIPIQGRPSGQLQPQRQQHNDLPELSRVSENCFVGFCNMVSQFMTRLK